MDGIQCLHLGGRTLLLPWSPGHPSSLFGVNSVLFGQAVQARVPCTCSRLLFSPPPILLLIYFPLAPSFRCFILGTCRRLSGYLLFSLLFEHVRQASAASADKGPKTAAGPWECCILDSHAASLPSKARQWHATPICLCIHPLHASLPSSPPLPPPSPLSPVFLIQILSRIFRHISLHFIAIAPDPTISCLADGSTRHTRAISASWGGIGGRLSLPF